MAEKINIMDKMLDKLIAEAEPIATERIMAAINEPDENLAFSPEYDRKMKKLFAKERVSSRNKKVSRNLTRIAAVFLIVTAIASTAILGAEAWRNRFNNFGIDIRDGYTIINFDGDFTADSFRVGDIYLRYVPQGFRFAERRLVGGDTFVLFTKDSSYFTVNAGNIRTSRIIDTADADIIRLEIGGFDAVFTSNRNINVLIWHDGVQSYMVAGNIDQGTIVMIAENMGR